MGNSKAASSKKKGQASVAEQPMRSGDALLQVVLWKSDRTEGPASVALAMVGDLLAASPCEMRDASSSTLTALFLDAIQAVRAARHLQLLLHGYFTSLPEPGMYGCVTLSDGKEPVPTPDLALFEQTQVVTEEEPAGVIFAGSLCEAARLIPGLNLRELSGGLLAAGGAGGAVFQLVLPPVPQGVAKSDLEIGRLPARVSVRVDDAANQVEKDVAKLSTANVLQAAEQSFVRRSAVSDGAVSKNRSPLIWVGVGVAAVAAVVLGIVLSAGSRKPVEQRGSQASQPVAAPEPVNVPVPPAPAPVRVAPSKSAEVAENKRKVAEVAKAKKAEEADSAQSANTGARSGGLTFDAGEIRQLIARADKDCGDGKFARAIFEYETVLKQDRTNASARQGLQQCRQKQGQ